MQTVVGDSAALIDLKKGGLLEIFARLPLTILVPEGVLADELLSFTQDEIAWMRRAMTVAVLNAQELEHVQTFLAAMPALSYHDGTSLVITLQAPGRILLTGDRRLREMAARLGIECHGVLWVVEVIARANLAPRRKLVKTLQTWRADSLVRLPRQEIEALLARLRD